MGIPVPMSSRSFLSVCVITLALSACGSDETVPVVEGVIDRETFVSTYVDLRVATIQLEGSEIALPMEQRDSLLAAHGVSAEDLTAFVEAHGRELDYMSSVWGEIEDKLEAQTPAPALGRDPA